MNKNKQLKPYIILFIVTLLIITTLVYYYKNDILFRTIQVSIILPDSKLKEYIFEFIDHNSKIFLHPIMLLYYYKDDSDPQVNRIVDKGRNVLRIDDIIESLSNKDHRIRLSSVYWLQDFYSTGIVHGVDEIISIAKNDNVIIVRVESIRALGKVREKKVIDYLINEALLDKEVYVRQQACSSLGEIGTDKCVNGLVDALNDKDKRVIGIALKELSNYPDKMTLNRIEPFLNDKDQLIRESAELILYKLNKTGDSKETEKTGDSHS